MYQWMWLWWKFCCCNATLCKMCDCENKTQHNWSSAAPCDTWRWSVNCDWHTQMRLGIVHHCCSCILEICIYGCILIFHSQVDRLGTLYNINSSFLKWSFVKQILFEVTHLFFFCFLVVWLQNSTSSRALGFAVFITKFKSIYSSGDIFSP